MALVRLLPGDIVPVLDSNFITDWGLTSLGRPPTMANSSPTGGLHLQAGHLHRCRVTLSLCRMASSSPTMGSHLQAGRLRCRRPPTPLPDDIVPVQDGHFVADWGLTPPGRPPMPSLGDIVPV
uniref:Uncharacterized protein n=1 Tax=Oryza punctata TaxID=4537 RepID=A0A0E0KMV4_ORYPU